MNNRSNHQQRQGQYMQKDSAETISRPQIERLRQTIKQSPQQPKTK